MIKKVRLSQCMIVKNEEKNIEQALSWGKGVVCEQIVVDTGSTDNTVSIAESMGAKVFHFQWTDDFSAAKNYALEQASGDWIAFLDADEYFRPEDVRKLMKLLNEIEASCNSKNKPHIIRSSLVNVSDSGMPLSSYAQDRIFQNLQRLRYHNRIHEKLSFPKGTSPSTFYNAKNLLTIIHTGYAESAFQETGKSERNIKLLQKELLDHPDSYKHMLYLGEALGSAGRREEADQMFRKILGEGILKLNDHFRNLTFYHLMKEILLRDNPEEEEELVLFYQQAVSFDSTYPDLDYNMGLWYIKRKNYQMVVRYMENGLKKLETYDGTTPVYMAASLYTVYKSLALACKELGGKQASVKYAVLSLRSGRYTNDILCMLLDMLKKEPGEAESAEGTYRILSGIYDFGKSKDRVFAAECAAETGFTSLKEKLYKLLSEEEKGQLADI